MTSGDLERIEKELNVVLPSSYREFMQSGKFGGGHGGTQDLTGLAEEVIAMTKDLRANGFFGAKWPDSFLVIGDDGAGDYYFTDVRKDRPAVFFADHEMTMNKNPLVVSKKHHYETFDDFWEFIQKLDEATERTLKKRWWQFLIRPIRFI